MNANTATQKLVYAAMGCDTVTGGDITQVQWDTKGIVPASRQVVFNFGALGTAGITALTVNASDTVDFAEGSGNEIFDFGDATLPADADDDTVWVVQIPENAGRYVSYVATAGAQACDISVLGIGIAESGPLTDAERGVADFQYATA